VLRRVNSAVPRGTEIVILSQATGNEAIRARRTGRPMDTEGAIANIEATITRLEVEMRGAAQRYEFERAAELRDRIKALRERELQVM